MNEQLPNRRAQAQTAEMARQPQQGTPRPADVVKPMAAAATVKAPLGAAGNGKATTAG